MLLKKYIFNFGQVCKLQLCYRKNAYNGCCNFSAVDKNLWK